MPVILVLDNRDSFTFNLVQSLQGLGAEVAVRRTDAIDVDEVRRLRPERILIGPGPGAPAGAGCSLQVLAALAGDVPILGVCLGHQALGACFGAKIGPALELVHGRAVDVSHDGQGVFRGLASPLACTRYNSLTVLRAGLPDCLEVTAWSDDGDIMGLRHRRFALAGVQFHPESILSREGPRMLANFLGSTGSE